MNDYFLIGLITYSVSWAFLFGFIRKTVPEEQITFPKLLVVAVIAPLGLVMSLTWLFFNRICRIGEWVGDLHNTTYKKDEL